MHIKSEHDMMRYLRHKVLNVAALLNVAAELLLYQRYFSAQSSLLMTWQDVPIARLRAAAGMLSAG